MKTFHFLKASALAVVLCAAVCASCGKDKDDNKNEETEEVKVESVELSSSALTLVIGDKATLTATVKPEDAKATVKWTSDKAAVAIVQSGVVTAISEGSAKITAEADGKTATCVVTVERPVVEVTGVTLDKATLPLLVGASEQLTATVAPDNAENKELTWTSSAEAVATVSSTGLVTAIGEGEATITAKASTGTAGTCIVSVAPTLTLMVDRTAIDATLAAGTYDIVVTANVAWTAASNQSWCSINLAQGSGGATITASVTENSGYLRTATITLTAGDLTQSVTVTQAAPEGFLIGGLTWALTNLEGGDAGTKGTFAASTADFGSLYQWNRPKGWPTSGDITGWDGETPTGTEWDAANDPSPDGWRVPTSAELTALVATGKAYAEKDAKGNPVAGYFFGTNAASATWSDPKGCIFLPMVVSRIADGSISSIASGFYWSSSQANASNASKLTVSKTVATMLIPGSKVLGNSLRCVKK